VRKKKKGRYARKVKCGAYKGWDLRTKIW
jgi:hypothetical protein